MAHRLRRISAVLWVVGAIAGFVVTNSPLGAGYYRAGINLLLVPAALLAVLAVWYVPWHRFDRDAFVVTSIAGLALVPLLVAWSGGPTSPFTTYYTFIVVFAALFYRPRLAAGVIAAAIVARCAPAWLGGQPAGAGTSLRTLLSDGAVYVALAYVARAMSGEMARLYGEGVRRLTERQGLTRQLDRVEQRYRSLFEQHPDGVYALDRDGTILAANATLSAMVRYPEGALLGLPALDLVAPAHIEHAAAGFALALAGTSHSDEIALRRADGDVVDVHVATIPMVIDGRVSGVYGIAKDITARKALERRLAHQAFHDPLTGLPNRALFLDRLGQALARTARASGAVAVLCLDLDRFKLVNDSMGHAAGDALLIATARGLVDCVRPGDTVARLGGDEFIVLLEGIDAVAEATEVADRMVQMSLAARTVGGREMVVSASVGIALSVREGDEPDALIHRADLALYRAKALGRGTCAVYDAGMETAALGRLDLEAALRRALEQGEFELHYQPRVGLADGRIEGAEALVRWRHRERGLLGPGEFIPLAAELGLLRPLGRWVLEAACRAAAAWRAAGTPLVISVNLAAPEFQQPGLTEEIAAALRATGLPAGLLQLEITEETLMDGAEATLGTLGRIKELGVQLAIDDFGTGYSSLNYLKRFPLDWLKVDKAFVDGLGANPEDTAIVRAILSLARALDLRVTAEGVETAEQAAHLRALGCDQAQGYLFARPLPAGEFAALLADGSAARFPLPNPRGRGPNTDELRRWRAARSRPTLLPSAAAVGPVPGR
jgi:diguanylate cyclase (GGDEF)-like protein/PAS domain S-box-containing protein